MNVLRGLADHDLRRFSTILIDDRGDAVTEGARASDLYREVREIDNGRAETTAASETDALLGLLRFLVTSANVDALGRDNGRIDVLTFPTADLRQAAEARRYEGVRAREHRRRA